MQKFKKITFILMLICLLATLLPGAVPAAEAGGQPTVTESVYLDHLVTALDEAEGRLTVAASVYDAQGLFTCYCMDVSRDELLEVENGVSSVDAALDGAGTDSNYETHVTLDSYDTDHYVFTGWTVNGAAARPGESVWTGSLTVDWQADNSLIVYASGGENLTSQGVNVQAVFQPRTGYAINVAYTNCTLEDSGIQLLAGNTVPTAQIEPGGTYSYAITNYYKTVYLDHPLEKIVINGTEVVVQNNVPPYPNITISGIDGITGGTVKVQGVSLTKRLTLSFTGITVNKDINIELVFALPEPDHTPTVGVAAGDGGRGAFAGAFFKENRDGGSVWTVSAAPASGFRLSGYSAGGDETVHTPEITWRHVTEQVPAGDKIYTDADGDELRIPQYSNSDYDYCDFDLTLTGDQAVTLYFEPVDFSLQYYGQWVDVPYSDYFAFSTLPFSRSSWDNYTSTYFPHTELYEACNAIFTLEMPIKGYIETSASVSYPYSFRVYAGDSAEPDRLLLERSGTTSFARLYDYTGSVYFMIDNMPSISQMTVTLDFLGQAHTYTFDVDMPRPSVETAALQAYYTGTFGLDKFGKAAYTEEEKAGESYRLYCENSRFRYYLREAYREQLNIVGRAGDDERPAALAAAKTALDEAAWGLGADAVVCVFANTTGVNSRPILTGVPTGSDNIAKTGVNAEMAMKAALEAQYPANWTFAATQSQFGSFVTGIRGGGEEDIGGSVNTTGYNSYGFWSYNGKFSEWGVTNYYVSDGDVLTWGNPDTQFTWDWAVLRWQCGDEALAGALAAEGIAYPSQDFYALTAGQLEDLFPAVDFSRYGQLREVTAEEAVIRLINAIGDVSSDSGEAILAARSAYDALDPAVQAAVTNYATLTAAEAAYAALGQQSGHTWQEALSAVLTTLQNGKQLGVGSTNGEWAVLALARNGSIAGSDASGQAPGYLAKLGQELDSKGLEGMASSGYTTYARIALALSSLGLDASSFTTGTGVHGLTDGLEEYDQVVIQGINGPVFALLALDAKPYLTGDAGLRDRYVRYILDSQLPGGGWAYSGDTADPDMTAMALQALAPYRANNTGAAAAVDRGLAALKGLQKSSGGFSSYGMYNAESTAQVIVALTALGVDPAGADWTTAGNLNPVEALLHFYDDVFGMFRHSLVGEADQMATEQSAYALVAYNRFATGKSPLYRMSDAFADPGVDPDADVQADVAAAKAAVEGLGAQSVSMNTANTKEGVLNYVRNRLSTLDLKNTLISVDVSSFTAATAGTKGSPGGTAGSFACAVTLSKTNGTDYASAAAQVSGVITALPYSDPSAGGTITVQFTLLGTAADGANGTVNTLSKNNLTTWIPRTAVTLNAGARVYDAFTRVLDEKGYGYVGAEDNYVRSITTPAALTLAEFTNGKKSGWMYTVNGTHPNVGLCAYVLSDGDDIVWHYTDDYTIEEGSEKWNSGKLSESTPEAATVTPKAAAANGAAAVKLSESDLKEVIAKAKENNSTAIVIAPEIAGEARKVSVQLPKGSLSDLASKTEAGLKVETPVGSMTIPNSALAAIVSQASEGAVTMSLESVDTSSLTPAQREAVGGDPVYDISIMSGSSHISSFNGEELTISLPYTLKEGEAPGNVRVWYLNDAGELAQMDCTYDAETGLATFATAHLSYYLVGVEATEEDHFTIGFTDVKKGDWFYEDVEFAVKNGLFSGTAETTFSPGQPMTRAMLVTVLHRLDGQPAAGPGSFRDVPGDAWYARPLAWSSANGIVSGYGDGLFGPDDQVTREQMAAILYRYAGYKGYAVTAGANLSIYADAADISPWARTVMSWANAEGLITGRTATTLAPGGNATRAEAAAILKRFVEDFVK